MTTVDAHHHFWDPSRAEYPWMTDELAAIRRPFGPADLEPLIRNEGIDATVLVQTRSSIEETEEFLRTAESAGFVAGVVGWADLTNPRVGDALAALRSGPGGDRLVAIRHQVHDEPDPEWLLRQDVRRGLNAVESAGLAYDVLVRTRELPAAIKTVREMPNARFVLDHIAKPPIAAREIEPWRALIRQVAHEPNVWCKVSGMITEADWNRWTVDDLRPYVDVVLGAFGPNRLLFGSDWPVCLVAGSYAQVADAARMLTSELSQSERDAVFGANAIEVYRLAAT